MLVLSLDLSVILICLRSKRSFGRGHVKVSIVLSGAFALVLFSSHGGSNEKYKDPKQPIGIRIRDLMKRMTLAEKIVCLGFKPLQKSGFNDQRLQHGSLFKPSWHPNDLWCRCSSWQQQCVQRNNISHNVGLGATRDPELVRKIGAATALEVRATGSTYAFAPCISVCRDPRWGQCYESYSEDPEIVQAMTETIPGLQGEIPANSRKGIPYVGGNLCKAICGDGDTIRGISENNTIIDWHRLMSIHIPAYYDSIIKGVATVMVSYTSLNGKKMHAHHQLITEFLKNTLKFRGFVISNWQGIDKITSPPGANYTYSVEAAINAGMDMVMTPFNHSEFIGNLTDLVKKNVISMSRIDDAVARILRVKFTMVCLRALLLILVSLATLDPRENLDPPLIPLPKKANKILVAGTHANNLGYQCGGWTITWQGLEGNNLTTGTTILSAISAAIDPSTQVVYSENPDVEFVKCPSTITNVCTRIKCVVVLISGRPLLIQPYLPLMDALVVAWLPGSEGQGVADVLFGDYGFTGKLPHTWFRTVEQLPMNFGDPHYDPLFPLGFGLTTKQLWWSRGGSTILRANG
ncbi:Beta-glucosidase BoGH3B [Vitis vinifera]|uniref:Beta-glucosidase BoGH3B n=1 Tax=Vitis vinifera TaxID=29760 RepID=A0A438FEF7_VITVI|nr:Beta-glucosidase BoGH3B [Vitis vinifera]